MLCSVASLLIAEKTAIRFSSSLINYNDDKRNAFSTRISFRKGFLEGFRVGSKGMLRTETIDSEEGAFGAGFVVGCLWSYCKFIRDIRTDRRWNMLSPGFCYSAQVAHLTGAHWRLNLS